MRYLYSFGGGQLADPYALTAGESVPTRLNPMSGVIALAAQAMRLSYFTAVKSETITQLRVWSGTTPSVLTFARLGVYAIDAAGAGTLVAATPNDAGLLAAASTRYVRMLSVPWAKVAGQRYALAVLVDGGTVGTVFGMGLGLAQEAAEPPRCCGVINALTDLPGSFTDAGVSASAGFVYGAVVP